MQRTILCYRPKFDSFITLKQYNGTYSSGQKITIPKLPGRQELLLWVRALGSGSKTGPWCDPVTLFVV